MRSTTARPIAGLVTSVLARMESMLAKPEAWTQWSRARTTDDARCAVEAPEAAKWCVLGAKDRAADDVLSTEMDTGLARRVRAAVVTAIAHAVDGIQTGGPIAGDLATWNDDSRRSHIEVLTAVATARNSVETSGETTGRNASREERFG